MFNIIIVLLLGVILLCTSLIAIKLMTQAISSIRSGKVGSFLFNTTFSVIAIGIAVLCFMSWLML